MAKMNKEEQLVCVDCGVVWLRYATRGPKPKRCKACKTAHAKILKRAKDKRYFVAHKDSVLDKKHKYYIFNKVARQAYGKQRYANNRYKLLNDMHEYAVRHKKEKAVYSKRRKDQRRSELIDALGGMCARCGAVHNLQFDHIDPSTKKYETSDILSLHPANPKRIAEIAKLQVLCAPCHKAKTRDEYGAGLLKTRKSRTE